MVPMHKKETFGILISLTVLLAPAFALAGDNSTVEASVRSFFADTPVMADIANCESQFHQFNSDGSVLHGGYRDRMIGIFQIAPMHESEAEAHGFDLDTITGNMAYAKLLYDQNGTSPWLDSMPCWGKMSVATSPTVRAAPVQLADTAAATQPLDEGAAAKISALKQEVTALRGMVQQMLLAQSAS